MQPDKRTARAAGLLYLIVVLTGMFSLVYVPSRIDTHTGPLATAASIAASASLFRWGALSELIMAVTFLLLPLVLYRLLHRVNHHAAVLMVALVAVSVPISIINVMHKLDILTLLDGSPALSQVLTPTSLNAAVRLHLVAYGNGMLVSEIFSGLWLLPFGYLVLRSTFLPRVLGALLIVGGVGYLIDFGASLLWPGYDKTALADDILLPASIGEIGTCLWLLVVGIRERAYRHANRTPNKQESRA